MAFYPNESDRDGLTRDPRVSGPAMLSFVVVIAMMLGAVVALVFFLAPFQPIPFQVDIETLVGVVMATGAITVSAVVPKVLLSGQVQAIHKEIDSLKANGMEPPETPLEGPYGRLPQAMMTKTIVAGAVLEGGAMINALLARNSAVNAVMVLVLLVVMTAHLPTTGRWVGRMLAEARQASQESRLEI